MKLDLHTHSTASDGTLAPAEVVELAAAKGLHAIALTDHDTVAGIAPATARGKELNILVIPGIEFGIQFPEPGQMHLLGYYINPQSSALLGKLKGLQRERQRRAGAILERLAELGCAVSAERVTELAQGESVGRPHIARALLEKGYVGSIGEAFQRFLKNGAPAYLPKADLDSASAIALVRDAGGVPVLAHPKTLKLPPDEFRRFLDRLQQEGLQGLEAYWSKHAPQEASFYEEAARERGLAVTGGSDFHGSNKPEIQIGSLSGAGGDGSDHLQMLKDLQARAASFAGPAHPAAPR